MKLNVAEIFSDHMVLQRGKTITVFGTAETKSFVEVTIQGKQGEAVADREGRWEVRVPALDASVYETMVIKSGDEKITIQNVAVGEVWIAGGQSNMEFQMHYDFDYEAERTVCENPLIRYFDVPKVSIPEMRELRDYSLMGYWRTADAANLEYFSAVGYYFAKFIADQLQVPVGIIGCNTGGTRSCCWVDEETVEACGPQWMREYEKGLEKIEDMESAKAQYLTIVYIDPSHPFDNPLSERMMKGLPLEELKELFAGMDFTGDGPVIGPWHDWRPAGLYHQMLETIIPYTVRGTIWYQGESDETHPECFLSMMKGLISLWRKRWDDEMPFLMTQLAPLGQELANDGIGFPVIREIQEQLTAQVSNVWLASTSDVGHAYDIHPKKKRPVGKRLGLLAAGHVYGKDLLCEAPVPDTVSKTERAVTINFKYADGGLMLRGDKVGGLQVFDGEKELVQNTDYLAKVQGSSLTIESLTDSRIGKVAFARTPYYTVNLFNMAGIPAKPFEI